MASVAFLGTGLLGGAMVEGMLRRGDAVTVWNRTEAKARALEAFGATVAATPGDAVAAAGQPMTVLPAIAQRMDEAIAVAVLVVVVAQAFRPAIAQQCPNALANFIKVQAPIVALVHARVIGRVSVSTPTR